MRTALSLAALFVLCLGAPSVRAEDAKPTPPPDARKAIDAGAAWLNKEFSSGYEGDSWHEQQELVVLTLAHCGANTNDKAFAKGIAVLERTVPKFTYRTALLAMALSEVNPRLYQWKIAHCAQWLVDTQLAGGEWGYPGTRDGKGLRPQGASVAPPPYPAGTKPGETPPPQGKIVITKGSSLTSDRVLKGDFSNTQFAILGLRACREAGVEVPKETWKAALGYLQKFQREDGGWGYVMSGIQDDASYSSLTCAAVCSLAVCLNALGAKTVKGDGGILQGLGWLDKNLDITKNAGFEQTAVTGTAPWQYYHLYSLERAGRVLNLDTIGKKSWYAEGTRWLIGMQHSDGSWADEQGPGGTRPPYFTVADTCFALLFLSRATRPITGG